MNKQPKIEECKINIFILKSAF